MSRSRNIELINQFLVPHSYYSSPSDSKRVKKTAKKPLAVSSANTGIIPNKSRNIELINQFLVPKSYYNSTPVPKRVKKTAKKPLAITSVNTGSANTGIIPSKSLRGVNQPNRDIICQDTRIWLKKQPKESIGNIVTGICDLDEIVKLDIKGGKQEKFSIEQYKTFFMDIAEQLMSKTAPDGYCIFIQTDRKYEGQWIDKSYLLNKVAEKLGLKLLWHKIVLLREVGHTDLHRPTYSHMMCFSKTGKPGAAFPDVIDFSKRLYKNGTPTLAAEAAIKFVKQYSPHSIVVDPFVGQGTIVAYANAYHLDAVGIDIDPEQCKLAKTFRIV